MLGIFWIENLSHKWNYKTCGTCVTWSEYPVAFITHS